MTIVTVTETHLLNLFIKLPETLYKGDSNWVRPLVGNTAKSFDARFNTLLKNIHTTLFLALDSNSVPIGRIALFINDTHNLVHRETTAFFGFFECVDDAKTAIGLLSAAEESAKAAGMSKIVGPVDFNMNYQSGFLIDGFTRPTVMTPYNKTYYSGLVEDGGYQKAMDLFAYTYTKDTPVSDRLERVANLLKTKRPEISVRPINSIPGYKLQSILTPLYNESFSDNWGYIPMTQHEFSNLLKSLKASRHGHLNYIAFSGDTPVGLLLTVPDSYSMKLIKNTRLPAKNAPNRLRLTVLGVIPSYRGKGIEALLGKRILDDARSEGYDEIEYSVILENNTAINNLIRREFGLPVTKTFRIYQKEI